MNGECPGRDLCADFSVFYDLYVGEGPCDLAFYRSYAESSQTPLLEIGAGSGRLTIPLARAGHAIVAVDVSPSMLALLRKRLAQEDQQIRERVTLIQADTASLALGTRHDLIFLPFYTFNYFLTPETAETVLLRCARHLTTEGRLLIDLFLPLRHIECCPAEPVLKLDRTDPETGCPVRGWNRYEIDTDRQIETRHHRFETTLHEGIPRVWEFTTHRRYYTPAEMEKLLSRCGLSTEAVVTGYGSQSREETSEQFTFVTRKT